MLRCIPIVIFILTLFFKPLFIQIRPPIAGLFQSVRDRPALILNLNSLIARLREAELPTTDEVTDVATSVIPILSAEPNVLCLDSPLTICGDTHGQLFDVIHLFEVAGNLPAVRYLILGDYVDRGYYSVELITLLLCYKLKFPTGIFLLRGNHETRAANRNYGFSREIQAKYASIELWRILNSVLDLMPFAAVVDSRLFCVHGGWTRS
jgi:hypothetical protein